MILNIMEYMQKPMCFLINPNFRVGKTVNAVELTLREAFAMDFD